MTYLEPIVAGWWQWIQPLSVQVALLAVVLGCFDRALCRRAPSGVRAAFAWAVWLRLILPPELASPLALGRFVDLTAWTSPGIVPQRGAAASPWIDGLFALWLAGAAVLALRTARTLARERATWLERAVIAGARVQLLADDAASRLRLARTPPVLLCAAASGPAAVGLLRPRVVLPSKLAARASSIELRNVLLHEFAHIARRDGIAAFAWTLARIVFWFHPLVHWTAARAATLREIGADERAARACGAVREYRRTLLEHARPLAARAGTGIAGFIPTGAQILARLEALERPPRCSATLARASAIGTFALLACCCVPMARRVPASAASLAELPGCLRQRYAVIAALARQSANDPASTSTDSQETRP